MSKSTPHLPWPVLLVLVVLSGCGPSDSEQALRAERDALRHQLEVTRQALAQAHHELSSARQEAASDQDLMHQLDVQVARLNGDNLLLTKRLAEAGAREAELSRRLEVAAGQTQASAPSAPAWGAAQGPAGTAGEAAPGGAAPDPSRDPPADATVSPTAPGQQSLGPAPSGARGDSIPATPLSESDRRILDLTRECSTLRERVGEVGAYARKKDDEITRLRQERDDLQGQLAQAQLRLQVLTLSYRATQGLLQDLQVRLDLTGQERDLAAEAARSFSRRAQEQEAEIRRLSGAKPDTVGPHSPPPTAGPEPAAEPGGRQSPDGVYGSASRRAPGHPPAPSTPSPDPATHDEAAPLAPTSR
jgi:hypothetical protein